MKDKIAEIIAIVGVFIIGLYIGYDLGTPPKKSVSDYELEEEIRAEYYDDGYNAGVYDSYDLVCYILSNNGKDDRYLDEAYLFNDGIFKVLYNKLDEDTAEQIADDMFDYSLDIGILDGDEMFAEHVKELSNEGILKKDYEEESLSNDWYDTALENAKKLDEEQRQKMYEELKNQE